MKKINPRNVSTFLVAIAATTFLLLGITQTFSQTSRKEISEQQKKNNRDVFFSQLRDGLGTEINYPQSQNAGEIKNAVNLLTEFIRTRSDFEISEWQIKITELEQKSIADKSLLISSDELADVLAEVAVRRIGRLTDEEVEQIADELSVAPNYVSLRADGRGSVERVEFVNELENARVKAGKKSKKLKNVLSIFMKSEINNRLSVYSKAVPNYFGKSQTEGLSPIQAV